MRFRPALAMLMLPPLAACGGATPDQPAAPTASASTVSSSDPAAIGATPSPTPTAILAAAETGLPSAAPTGRLSCAVQIGQAAAQRRAGLCRSVSPATHPPCNVANSCAMIEDEIARSCALFDGKGEPMAGCTPAPKSMAAAAAVVTRYYSALDAHDYDTAWQQWGADGPPRQTRAGFEAGFAHTRSTQVTIGRLTPGDGGAGSIYQTVPVTVDATLDNGTHQRFAGDYVLRRVSNVDGATPDQLRWHIDSAQLRPVKG